MGISILNPLSSEYQALKEFPKLTFFQKITTIALSIFAAIATIFMFGLGGVATFRSLVERFTKKTIPIPDPLPSPHKPKSVKDGSIDPTEWQKGVIDLVPPPTIDKISLNNLQGNRLVPKEEMVLRFQDIKFKKKSPKDFSTIVAETTDGQNKLFALYRGCDAKKGNCGKVKLAQDLQTGEWCAVKISRESTKATDAYKDLRLQVPGNEKRALETLKEFKGSAYRLDSEKEQHVFYIFMKYVDGKCNYENIGQTEFLEICTALFYSLKELHEKGFLHRDIKLSNTLYNRNPNTPPLERARLIDYGSALPMDENGEVVMPSSFGTTLCVMDWKHPDGKFHFTQYTDMFSMGEGLSRLWEHIKRYRSSTITSPISHSIWELLNKIYPYTGACYSKITALEAYEQFSSLLCTALSGSTVTKDSSLS